MIVLLIGVVFVFHQIHAFHVSNVVLIIVLGSTTHLLLGKEYLLITFDGLWLLFEILRTRALLLKVFWKLAILHRLWWLQRFLRLLLLLSRSTRRGGYK